MPPGSSSGGTNTPLCITLGQPKTLVRKLRMLSYSVRPLNGDEKEALERAIGDCQYKLYALSRLSLCLSVFPIAMAWGFSLWAGPWLAPVLGLLVGGLVTYMTYRSEARTLVAQIERYRDALERDEVRGMRVQSQKVVAIKLGLWRTYAFQADDQHVVVLSVHSTECDGFPNDDFDLLTITTRDGWKPEFQTIETQGSYLPNVQTLVSSDTYHLRQVTRPEVLEGKLYDIMALLAKP